MRPLRILFAGGGTGGHIFPAIAIAEEVRKLEPTADLLFVGTKNKIEARVVPLRGFQFKTIWISGFHRSFRLSNFMFPLKVIVSMFQARKILREYDPDVVVGTGGYVSGPIVRSAVALNIPTLIQEQNSFPGMTTRLLARKVDEVHLTFEESKEYLAGAKNMFLTGNPTRDSLDNAPRHEAFEYFGFNKAPSEKTILVFGGSLGAHTINVAMAALIDKLQNARIRVIWQTGKEDVDLAMTAAKMYPREQVWISAFIDRMDYAYAASDLVVSRAGATTIAELTRLGKPAILVPYPHAAANHQGENARTLAERGAAIIIHDDEVTEKLLVSITRLLDENRLQEMSRKSRALGKPDAARIIARHVIMLGRKKVKRIP